MSDWVYGLAAYVRCCIGDAMSKYKGIILGKGKWGIMVTGLCPVEVELDSETQANMWASFLNGAYNQGKMDGIKNLGSGLNKFAPDLCAKLVERYKAADEALMDLVKLMQGAP